MQKKIGEKLNLPTKQCKLVSSLGCSFFCFFYCGSFNKHVASIIMNVVDANCSDAAAVVVVACYYYCYSFYC